MATMPASADSAVADGGEELLFRGAAATAAAAGEAGPNIGDAAAKHHLRPDWRLRRRLQMLSHDGDGGDGDGDGHSFPPPHFANCINRDSDERRKMANSLKKTVDVSERIKQGVVCRGDACLVVRLRRAACVWRWQTPMGKVSSSSRRRPEQQQQGRRPSLRVTVQLASLMAANFRSVINFRSFFRWQHPLRPARTK